MKERAVKLSTLKLNDRNPRLIKDEAFQRLCESIKRDPQFLVLRPIIIDEENIIIGGNQRYRACKHLGMTEVPSSWVKVAMGLTQEERKRFILIDNAPEGMSGTWDFEMLQSDWESFELEELGFSDLKIDLDQDITKDAISQDDTYTKKIVVPIYEPKGECPDITSLFDHTKSNSLHAEIKDARLPDEVTKFLRLAAERHTVFNFSKIAEFYCHATPKVQDLMEKSGLVIIDFKKAIEYGFVHMTEQLGILSDAEENNNERE